MTFTFNSQIKLGASVELPSSNTTMLIKNEPMLFSCDLSTASKLGGTLTKQFLNALDNEWINRPGFVLDSRVHMLKKGWWPAIPGYHHDDVPRDRKDGQPNYSDPCYKAQHAMMLINAEVCPTEFVLGAAEFEDVPLGEVYYRKWHPVVEEKLKSGELKKVLAPNLRIVYFDWETWHQGTAAALDGWRFFVRASVNTKRVTSNEVRRQVQVYLEKPMDGW
jgi:hypothetical protein